MSTTPADQPEPTAPTGTNHDVSSSPSGTDDSAADVSSTDGSAGTEASTDGSAGTEASTDGSAGTEASTLVDASSELEAPETADLVSEHTDSSVLDPEPDEELEADEEAETDEAPATLTAYPDEAHPVVLDTQTLRRAPRFGRFALVAVLGGLLLGVVVGYVIFPATHPGWSRTIFAFEVMLVTLAVTLLAALASDRRSRRPRRR